MARNNLDGLWTDILQQALPTLDRRALAGRDGPCPICGGADRFRYDNKNGRGTWYCRKCGAGDGYRLIMAVREIEFPEAARIAEQLAGVARKDPDKPKLTPERVRMLLGEAWKGGVADHPGLRSYLTGRGLQWREQRAVRYHPATYWRHGDQKGQSPAMLARVYNSDTHRPITLHRTYLHNVPCARKKLMPTLEKKQGTYIPLFGDPIDGVLGVAEGIESAWSGAQLDGFSYPVWATVDEQGMRQFVPPEGVKKLIIFGDPDSSYVGQAAAFSLAEQWQTRNRRKIECEVRFPPSATFDYDWNDYLRGQGNG